MNIFLRNTGRSPAIDVVTEGHVVFGAKAKRGCFAFSGGISKHPQAGSVIGSGGMVWATSIAVVDDLADMTRAATWNGEEPIMVYFVIRYRDIFNRTHRAKTCLETFPGGRFHFIPSQNWIDY